VKNFREYYHDAIQQREELFSLFELGYLSLEDRGRGEALFDEICLRALRFAKQTNYVSDEFELLEKTLRKKYVANFSVFQSVPDSWSIGLLFPVLPIHRLNEYPTETGIVVDLTCDSDGQIDHFVDIKDIKEMLELHATLNGGPYYIAVTMLGAYQDVMGDFHNLFGTVNEAHVVVDEGGRHHVRKIVRAIPSGDGSDRRGRRASPGISSGSPRWSGGALPEEEKHWSSPRDGPGNNAFERDGGGGVSLPERTVSSGRLSGE
jgi:arginine decarboxylase